MIRIPAANAAAALISSCAEEKSSMTFKKISLWGDISLEHHMSKCIVVFGYAASYMNRPSSPIINKLSMSKEGFTVEIFWEMVRGKCKCTIMTCVAYLEMFRVSGNNTRGNPLLAFDGCGNTSRYIRRTCINIGRLFDSSDKIEDDMWCDLIVSLNQNRKKTEEGLKGWSRY